MSQKISVEVETDDMTGTLLLKETFATVKRGSEIVEITRSLSGLQFYIRYPSGKCVGVDFQEALMKMVEILE